MYTCLNRDDYKTVRQSVR